MNDKRSIKGLRWLPIGLLATALLCACSSIDCPLNNRVYTQYVFKGEADTLKDTLTVIAVRPGVASDTVVFNRGVNLTSLLVPVSYTQAEDVLAFQFTNAEGDVTTDTVWITKENQPHFESVECSPNFFHTLTGIRCTHKRIDDIAINHPNVDYDATKEHIYIYIRPDE